MSPSLEEFRSRIVIKLFGIVTLLAFSCGECSGQQASCGGMNSEETFGLSRVI